MQCQVCNKNDATIHLTEINDGVRAEMHICEQCAQEQGIAVKSQIPLNELLSSLLAVQPSDEDLFGPSEKGPAASCSNCGFTLDQFRKELAVGRGVEPCLGPQVGVTAKEIGILHKGTDGHIVERKNKDYRKDEQQDVEQDAVHDPRDQDVPLPLSSDVLYSRHMGLPQPEGRS